MPAEIVPAEEPPPEENRVGGGEPTRTIVVQHHALVRISHWLNIPILLMMILSGLSIYWASPVLKHAPDPGTGNTDYLADAGAWAVAHLPGQHGFPQPRNWFYDHFSLGHGILAEALRLHWLFAYLFMANGLVYLAGLVLGRGWRALVPRPRDAGGAFAMVRYYGGVLPAKILRRPWPHPPAREKYNALQKLGYFSMPVAGALAIATGWAIHKPAQLGWLERLFGGYDRARIWHLLLLVLFVGFVIPHVVLVIADGWDTLRSMVVGWSARLRGEEGDDGA
ncbi:MAG TPA: cytochrome b/b6 domain-containing protein [Thermoanaerobaculia bacterium]|nr:cytochrome b/b6 domain-containing protein [Thermoanaerobaculia bacterium]